MTDRLFILGCGTQKSGTSWVHHHLQQDPSVNFGPLKEYHVFNALHLPEYAFVTARRDPSLFRQTRRFLRLLIRERRIAHDELLRRRLRRGNAYYDFFSALLTEGTKVTGDLTPDYAGLPTDVFKSIKSAFSERNVQVRAIFMMRDPVERCLSAARMYRGRAPDNHHLPISQTTPTGEALLTLYRHPRFEMLTRYDLTLESLEQAFEASELYVGFYEDLFTSDKISKIELFCGVAPRTPNFSRRVNESGFKTEDVDDDILARVARHYRGVYDAAANRFGADAMRQRWTGYRYL